MFCASYPQDTGRMDESKVTDGKAVLMATLGSRGLPTEDRIRAAVDAAEAERSECLCPYVLVEGRSTLKIEQLNYTDIPIGSGLLSKLGISKGLIITFASPTHSVDIVWHCASVRDMPCASSPFSHIICLIHVVIGPSLSLFATHIE